MKHFALAAAFAAITTGSATAQTLSIATLPQGSAWNTMGSAIAGAVREDGFRIVVQPYGGNVAMLQAVQQQLAEFAVNDVNEVIGAVNGRYFFEGQAQPELRIVARLMPQVVGMFVRESLGITEVRELKGKRVPSGMAVFPIGISNIEAILAADGLSYADVTSVPTQSLISGADDVAANRLDTMLFAVGAPKVAEVGAAVGGVRFLKFGADREAALEAVRTIRPAYNISTVEPAPFRVGLSEPMDMLTYDIVLVAGSHVSDEAVYQMLARMAETRDAIVAAFPPMGPFAIDIAWQDYPSVSYHPGALRYFADNGIQLQSN